MTRPFVFALVVGAIAAGALIAPALVRAHADYDRSFPGNNAVVRAAPGRVDVWFTQDLFRRLGANNIEVYGPDGSRADKGDFVLDDADRKHASVGLNLTLPPGKYEVRWTTLSAIDGDSGNGSFSFTIDPNAPEPTAPPSSAQPGPSTGEGGPGLLETDEDALPVPPWALIAAGALLSAGALGAWALLGPPPKERA